MLWFIASIVTTTVAMEGQEKTVLISASQHMNSQSFFTPKKERN